MALSQHEPLAANGVQLGQAAAAAAAAAASSCQAAGAIAAAAAIRHALAHVHKVMGVGGQEECEAGHILAPPDVPHRTCSIIPAMHERRGEKQQGGNRERVTVMQANKPTCKM